jgi:integrase
MPSKYDHLQMHGGTFRVVMGVPIDVRPAFGGKRYFLQSLGTANPNEANRLKGVWLTRWRSDIALARRPGDPNLKGARMLGRQWARGSDDEAADAFAEAVLRGDELAVTDGADAGDRFFKIVTGQLTSLDEFLDEWIADRHYSGKTAVQHRQVFAELTEWCKTQSLEPTLQSITRRVALRFRDEHLKPRLSPKSVNRYLSSYRTHWKWLIEREQPGITTNPWAGTHQAIKRLRIALGGDRDEGKKRPFTDEEVRTLLAAAPRKLGMRGVAEVLPDLMRLAALTGARIDAICQLQVRDCQKGVFRFQPQKREPDVREVPIHSSLKSIVAQRTKGKSPKDFLIHELPKQQHAASSRSSPAVKSFARLRRKLGIDERPNGRHQSNVDFHSWRRWFSRKAREALEAGVKGFTPWTIAEVLGHDPEEQPLPMTMARYAGPAALEARRACVEAVKPPSPRRSRRRSLQKSRRHR